MDIEISDSIVDINVDNKSIENTETESSSTKDVLELSSVDNKHNKNSENNISNTHGEKKDTTLPQITNVIGNVDMSQISHLPSSSNNENKLFKDNFEIETIDLDDDTEDLAPNNTQKDIMDSFISKKVPENFKNVETFSNGEKNEPVLNIKCKEAIERALQDLKTDFEPITEVNELDIEIAKKANDYINRKTNNDPQSIKSDLELEIAEKADLFIKSRKEKIEDDFVIADLEFADDGIEFIDDGIVLDDNEKADIVENSKYLYISYLLRSTSFDAI